MNNYVSRNHSKYYLKVHLIFVCKYRKKLLINNFDNIVKNIILEISYRSNFIIDILRNRRRSYPYVNIISTKIFGYINSQEIKARNYN